MADASLFNPTDQRSSSAVFGPVGGQITLPSGVRGFDAADWGVRGFLGWLGGLGFQVPGMKLQ